jgi:hypothetical protein
MDSDNKFFNIQVPLPQNISEILDNSSNNNCDEEDIYNNLRIDDTNWIVEKKNNKKFIVNVNVNITINSNNSNELNNNYENKTGRSSPLQFISNALSPRKKYNKSLHKPKIKRTSSSFQVYQRSRKNSESDDIQNIQFSEIEKNKYNSSIDSQSYCSSLERSESKELNTNKRKFQPINIPELDLSKSKNKVIIV